MKLLKDVQFTLPLVIFILIFAILWRGLSLHPNQIPSPLIDKPAPNFKLPQLTDPQHLTNNQDFLGHVTLLNVWATWCEACLDEHSALLHLAQNEHLIIYGMDYKDNPGAAKRWLKEKGNPYQMVAVDQEGLAAIDWGVYGTPETFVIDKKGIVRHKQIGPITQAIWQNELKPLVQKLESDAV